MSEILEKGSPPPPTCFEPREKLCSVEITVKCTGPKSKLYQGESAKGSFAGPGMMNLTVMVAGPIKVQHNHLIHWCWE